MNMVKILKSHLTTNFAKCNDYAADFSEKIKLSGPKYRARPTPRYAPAAARAAGRILKSQLHVHFIE